MMPNDRHGIAVTPRATALCSSARGPPIGPPLPPWSNPNPWIHDPIAAPSIPQLHSIAMPRWTAPARHLSPWKPLAAPSRRGRVCWEKRHKTSPPPPLTAWQVLVFVFWSLVVLLENPTPFSVVLVLQESCYFVSPSIHQAHHGFRLPTDHVTGVDHDASRRREAPECRRRGPTTDQGLAPLHGLGPGRRDPRGPQPQVPRRGHRRFPLSRRLPPPGLEEPPPVPPVEEVDHHRPPGRGHPRRRLCQYRVLGRHHRGHPGLPRLDDRRHSGHLVVCLWLRRWAAAVGAAEWYVSLVKR